MQIIDPVGPSIGLFGGSFNPAHAGHMHLAQTAQTAFNLDQIWWLVSPQNPLKPAQPPYVERVASVEALGLPRSMKVAHLERDFGTQYTVDLITRTQRLYPHNRFVFLMGADNFSQLPKWRDWHDIVHSVPIGVIARPEKSGAIDLKPRLGQAAKIYRSARIAETASHRLPTAPAPAWSYVTTPLNRLSSSAIRALKQ